MKVEEKKLQQVAKQIKEDKKPVMLFICKKNFATRILIKPILNDLQDRYKEKIIFYDIDRVMFAQLKEQYAIYRYPTFLFFKKGILVHKLEGLISRLKLFRYVQKIIEDEETPIQQKK